MLVLNTSDTFGFATGYQLELGLRRVFDKDTLDDFFSAFAGLSVGHFQWYGKAQHSNSNSLYVAGELGFTPTSDTYFSVNAKYLPRLNAFAPNVTVEARPFTYFLWTRHRHIQLVFSLEGGFIKYLKKPTSPTGYVSFNMGLIYGL